MRLPKHNLSGKRFSRLLVGKSTRADGRVGFSWECLCDCGRRIIARSKSLLDGSTKSCGCLNAERLKAGLCRTHGLCKAPEYRALRAAIGRCQPHSADREHYYDRGISVCQQWQDPGTGLQDFIAHIGPRPSPQHSLDRIDNDKGYEPGNVRWATKKEQANNRGKRLRIDRWTDTELLAEALRRGFVLAPQTTVIISPVVVPIPSSVPYSPPTFWSESTIC
jgi:hypothetical protein